MSLMQGTPLSVWRDPSRKGRGGRIHHLVSPKVLLFWHTRSLKEQKGVEAKNEEEPNLNHDEGWSYRIN